MLHRVCTMDELPEDGWKLILVNGANIVVGRRHGQLFAFDNSCPHRGASLAKGEFNGDNIVCYMHRYEYNVFSGRLENKASWKKEETWVEQSEEWRKSGDLVLFPVHEKDGHVYVEINK